nr:MAG TPA: hypothetical protein [Caudoviricetes sp.]DAW04872.1 MAG TPA: hypothetical protein [Caudoviricetes sp.]DAZ38796.1 MAG TPA: hypothetical protein [Caudoviricetes sp.]DAZ46343.1 MAG TPA: hypothetical protein [Caudoviricetes sp.]
MRMSLFCCDFFRTFKYIIRDIFRMSIIIFAIFSEFYFVEKIK